LNAAGEIVDEGQLRLNRATVLGYLSAKSPGARVALETGGHSTWVREVIEQVGHEAVVANARELEAVTVFTWQCVRRRSTSHHATSGLCWASFSESRFHGGDLADTPPAPQ
jgi:phosphoserine phosphatase